MTESFLKNQDLKIALINILSAHTEFHGDDLLNEAKLFFEWINDKKEKEEI